MQPLKQQSRQLQKDFFKIDSSPKAQSYVRAILSLRKDCVPRAPGCLSLTTQVPSPLPSLTLRRKTPVAAGHVNTHPTGHFITQILGGMGKCSDCCCGF